MTDLTIAMDMDSVLAATHETAFDLLEGEGHDRGYDDVESWAWGIEQYGEWSYLSALWHAWTIRGDDIPLLEECVPEVMQVLDGADWLGVDVVTATPGHDGIAESKVDWLAQHDIPCDNFIEVPMNLSKSAFPYDVFVDDKPSLPGDVAEVRPSSWVFLRDQPYNRDVDLDHDKHVRVSSLADVPNRLWVEGWDG